MRMWPRRMVWQRTSPSRGCDNGLAREAEVSLQMTFRLGHRRESIHPLDHFDHALFALALLAAGGRHVDAQSLGLIE